MTSRPAQLDQPQLAGYRPADRGTQPDYLYPPYSSTVKRSPSQPLVLLPMSLSEVTGPLFGWDIIRANDFDLTKQHAGDPIGERIVVSGRVIDANARPVADTLIAPFNDLAAVDWLLGRRRGTGLTGPDTASAAVTVR